MVQYPITGKTLRGEELDQAAHRFALRRRRIWKLWIESDASLNRRLKHAMLMSLISK